MEAAETGAATGTPATKGAGTSDDAAREYTFDELEELDALAEGRIGRGGGGGDATGLSSLVATAALSLLGGGGVATGSTVTKPALLPIAIDS